MQWRKVDEYRAFLDIDGEVFDVVVRKEDEDEYYRVHINHEYVSDCEEMPDREYLEQIIGEEKEVASRTSSYIFGK